MNEIIQQLIRKYREIIVYIVVGVMTTAVSFARRLYSGCF